jgi:oligosaccharide repeat unit polymerase
MNLISLSIFVILINLVHIFYTYSRTSDILHYTNLFSLIFLINYPLMMIVNLNGIHVLNSNDFGVINQYFALCFAFMGWFFFNLPFYLSKKTKLGDIGIKNAAGIILNLKISHFLFIIIIFIFLIHGKNVIYLFNPEALHSIRGLRLQEQAGTAGRALISIFLNITVIFFIIKLLLKNKMLLFYIFVLSYGYIIMALTTSKTAALTPVLISFFMFHYFYKNFSLISSIKYFFTGAFLLIFLAGARALNMEKLDLLFSLRQLANAFDGMENLVAVTSRVKDYILGDDFYWHYIEYLIIAPIPRAIWPGKPELYGNLSIQQQYIPELFFGQNGMTVSPSFVGAMLIDGGIIGIILTSSLVGGIFLFLYKKFLNSNNTLYLFIYLYLFLSVISYLRIGIGIFSSLYVAVVIFIIYIIAFKIITYNQYKRKIKCAE